MPVEQHQGYIPVGVLDDVEGYLVDMRELVTREYVLWLPISQNQTLVY